MTTPRFDPDQWKRTVRRWAKAQDRDGKRLNVIRGAVHDGIIRGYDVLDEPDASCRL